MKLYIYTFIFLVLTNFSFSQTSTAPLGTGTLCDPYQITSLNNLYWITQNSSSYGSGKYFIQTANIDASSTSTWNSGAGFPSIGTFQANYDGNGYSISNLYINRAGGNGGIFGYLYGATIKNLTISSPNITFTSGSSNGIVAGMAGSSTTITNVIVSGGSYTYTGGSFGQSGFIGDIWNSTITSCSTSATVSSNATMTGGFVGRIQGASTFNFCSSSSSITMTGSVFRVGGFAGQTEHSSGSVNFNSCFSKGSISGSSLTGGFIGLCYGVINLNDCYSTGNLSSVGWPAGGFFGNGWTAASSNTVIFRRCYSTGSVSLASGGGFGGNDYSFFSYNNCFWDNQSSGKTSAVGSGSRTGIMGQTTSNMKTQATFTNASWDFSTKWSIASGVNNGYPNLIFPTVTITGFIPCVPTITTAGTFTSFSSCQGTASSNQSLTVSGSNLTANISISAPSGFEISTNASSGFGSSLTLTQSGGSVASTTIFIRMTAAASGSPSGNISLTSTGATTVDKAVSGTLASLTIGTASSSQVVCYNTNASDITLSGSSGTIQWQKSTDNSSWSNISGATSATITAAQIGSVTSTTFIRAQVTSGSCSGNSNTITLEVNNALAFDGSGDFVNIGNNASLNFTSNFTIESWVFVPASPKYSINTIFSKKNPGVWTGYMFGFNNYQTTDLKLTFECGNSFAISSTKTLNAGSWNHVAIVVSNNGTLGTFYLNGSFVGNNSILLTNASSFNEFIGSMDAGGMYSLQGSLDELRIWNVARTQQEIIDNMDNTLTGSESGLVAYYDFDQGIPGGTNTGITSVLNKTANSLNGSFTGISRSGTTSNFVDGNHAAIVSSDYGCVNGNSAKLIVGATGKVPSSIQWYKNTTNSTSGATLIPSATSQVFNTDANESSTKFYYAQINGTCASSSNSNIISLQNPVVTGNIDVYEDNTTQLACSDAAAASSPWVSLNTSLLTTNSTGLITGIYPGTGKVVYTTNAACTDTVNIVVHATEWNGSISNDFSSGSNWKLNTKPNVIKKIRFNNTTTNNMILTSRMSVDSIDFGNSDKQIELGNHDLIVNHIRNFNANKYIKTTGTGMVKKQLTNNTSFTFPVGNKAYNPITITNKTGTADTFSINILDTAYLNGSTSGNIRNPYVKRTWNISKNTASANAGSGVDLTFNWNANEVVGTLTNPTLNHHNGSGWEIPLMGVSSVSGNSLTYTGYKGTFSPFAIGGSTNVALPVELKSFDATCSSDHVQIEWTTASEKNNDRFELYKSLDAKTWTKIYTVKGQGTKATETNYRFFDFERQLTYYRLNDIDFNGKISESNIIVSNCKDEIESSSISPNPATDYIMISTPWKENTMLRIITLNGVVLKEEQLISSKSYVSVKDLKSGIYLIEIEKKGSMERLKLFKQ